MNTKFELDFYKKILPVENFRIGQAEILHDYLSEHFNFPYVECIETGASQDLDDGCFGLYLAKICESNNGIFHSVDLSETIVEKSKKMFSDFLPNFTINQHCVDSVEFLKSYNGSPNLVHLDSWDLDLTNPVPSMLHGFLEFQAIKDKMPSGSIIIVDDNFLKGTWVHWRELVNGEMTGNYEKIDINYEIVGKGSLIYHWCQKSETEWDILDNHHQVGSNIKLIIKKR